MATDKSAFKSGILLNARSILIWRIVQAAVWLAGAFILMALIFFPSMGILLFWNVLIPVAPLLFVLLPGVWRNVCPLATTNLLPRHFNLSKRKRLSVAQSGVLNLIAVIALYLIVPLRHAVFNSNGMATALLIIAMAAIGVIAGFYYEWKSAWCSGLCPIHPVEKLYGSNVLGTIPNAHCGECRNCVIPCPDSTPNMNVTSSDKTFTHQVVGFLTAGGLPGFIWGWFHVPDEHTIVSLATFISVYRLPLTGMAITLFAYAVSLRIAGEEKESTIARIFAAAGVSCYYWFRIPALFGFGEYADDGLLIDLSKTIPAWSVTVFTVLLIIFFFYWIVIRKQNNQSWVIRPPYAAKQQAVNTA